MHPLLDNLKNLTFEELEKRSSEIIKRMQILRRSGITTTEVWDQLQMLLDNITAEKTERAVMLNTKAQPNHVVVNTDPLDDDQDTQDTKSIPRSFNPIS